MSHTAQAVATSDALVAGNVYGVETDTAAYAVWRDSRGTSHAWEDRCPHRGMRLSFGFVREDRLTCLYHGWQFKQDGACGYIPAHPDLTPPETLCAQVFPTFERYGVVFVGTAKDDGDDTGQWHAVRSVYLDVEPETALTAIGAEHWLGDASVSDDGGVLTGRTGLHALAAVAQARPYGHSVLHVTTTGSDPETRIALARKLVGFRRRMNEGNPT